MTARESVLWLAATAASAWTCWATATSSPVTVQSPPTPAPLTRQPTAAEVALVRTLAEDVLSELRASARRVGHPPALGELEALAPDGQPFLPSGLPDNPLAPGVAGVASACEGAGPTPQGIDWMYCPEPLRFEPGHDRVPGVQSGNP